MTLTVLELIASEGKRIGNIRFNSETGMKLQKENINFPYCKWLANEGLLTVKKDYSKIGLSDYIPKAKECLNKNSNERIEIKERKLNTQIEKLVMRYYSQK